MAKPRVFISYAHDTKPLAEELTQALLHRGIQTWVDFNNLKPGDECQLELDRAIKNAQSFLILVGPKSRGTPWQEAEWTALLTKAWADSEKRLLPVIVGSSEPPPFLRNWVSLRVDPSEEPQTWTHRVADALGSIHSPTARGLTAKSKREREKRLNEISEAVKALDRQPLGDMPTVLGQ
jgi:hypothetical protein